MDGWKDGRTDGQTLFYTTLQVEAGGPKKNNNNNKWIKKYGQNTLIYGSVQFAFTKIKTELQLWTE